MYTTDQTPAQILATKLGITNVEIAERVGLSNSQVGRIMKGKNAPSVYTAGRIASLLGVSVQRLWPPWAA